mmetsp:Transcript_8867/g.37216  ORF Transcript_8867/g.37216 Transcript_8867/m.37216 type:complete len:207 (-) Transcript_8867:2353-2973(-)
MHTLYPSNALWTRYFVSSKTSAWVESAPNTRSKLYERGKRSSRHGCSIVNASGKESENVWFSLFSFSERGRVRANTRIFPFMSSMVLKYFLRSALSSLYFASSVSTVSRCRLMMSAVWRSRRSTSALNSRKRSSSSKASRAVSFSARARSSSASASSSATRNASARRSASADRDSAPSSRASSAARSASAERVRSTRASSKSAVSF